MCEDNLIEETIKVLKHVVTAKPNDTIIMVGHSMGGSIVCKTTQKI